MVSTLYVETNYVLGYAQGRDPFADQFLLASELWPFRLAIPEVCLMESFSTYNVEEKTRREFVDRLKNQIHEMKRDRTSVHAHTLQTHLQDAKIEVEHVLRDFRNRLDSCVQFLVESADVFSMTHDAIRRSLWNPLIDDPTDNLILHGILGHAESLGPGPKAFLSGNSKDFRKENVQQVLLKGGIRYFSDSQAAAGWLMSQTDLPPDAEIKDDPI